MNRSRKWLRVEDGLPEMLASASLSVEAFKALVAAGKAPKPFYQFPGRALWDRSTLSRWLAARTEYHAQIAAQAAAEVIA